MESREGETVGGGERDKLGRRQGGGRERGRKMKIVDREWKEEREEGRGDGRRDE